MRYMKPGELIVSTDTVGYWCPLLKADEMGMITNPETGEVIQT